MARLKDIISKVGLRSEHVQDIHVASLSVGRHVCEDAGIVPVPSFMVADVGMWLPGQSSRWLYAHMRFEPYRVDGAVILHENVVFRDIRDYRIGSFCEAACLLAQMPWIGSVRGTSVYAPYELQVYQPSACSLWASVHGSTARHHLLYVPQTIKGWN